MKFQHVGDFKGGKRFRNGAFDFCLAQLKSAASHREVVDFCY